MTWEMKLSTVQDQQYQVKERDQDDYEFFCKTLSCTGQCEKSGCIQNNLATLLTV